MIFDSAAAFPLAKLNKNTETLREVYSLHATKAIKRKEELKTTLKEFHSERISLESEITKSSKQTEIAERLKETGLKEITTPPIKLTRDAKK